MVCQKICQKIVFLMILYAIITLSQGWQNLHRLTLSELQMVVDTCVYK